MMFCVLTVQVMMFYRHNNHYDKVNFEDILSNLVIHVATDEYDIHRVMEVSGAYSKKGLRYIFLYITIHQTHCTVSHGSVVVSNHSLYAGGPGSIPTAVTTMTAAGGDAEHVSLNH